MDGLAGEADSDRIESAKKREPEGIKVTGKIDKAKKSEAFEEVSLSCRGITR
jgi:hypothetical protein